ncbi:SLBB domain-containing protein [Hydrogenophaga sp.]|uniref:polysaccharide biosynthesis/export family protein n=1 Tax=Hydrogenophaga sp. TaxID=1904254 RepID=UPI0035673EAA
MPHLHCLQRTLALPLAALLTVLALSAQAQEGAAVAAPTMGTAAVGTGASGSQLSTPASAQQAAPGGRAAPAPNAPGNASSNTPTGTGDADAPAESTSGTPQALRRAPTHSQFQQFVKESTGLMLPMYGSELFEATQTYSADAALPPPADYILGPGDEVQMQVWGAVDLAGRYVIDRNGQIVLPKVGAFTLAGVPVRELEAVLRRQLAKVFTNFELNANMGRLRSIQIYVVGQAQQPGTFKVSSLSTLVSALFASGGPTANGSMRNIQLKRSGQTVTTLDLYDFIAKGDKGRDLPLQSGDVIVIPPVGPRVAVTGAYDHAAIYELKTSSSTVGDILSLGGGVPSLASTSKALLERIAPASTPPRQVQDITLDADGLRLPLRDGDVLTMLGISPAFANAVTLQGTVAAPLRYRWFEGMRILDLIPERDALITGDYYKRKNLLVQNADAAQDAGRGVASRVRGLADEINWEYAVIERLNRDTLSTELIPFNLGKAVLGRDPAHNLPLRAGDVVTILSQKDLRLPQDRQTRLVRVEGEVAAPGVYQTLPGETLPQLIQRIGGLTPQAYVFGVELNRESVRTRQQENLEILIRRLEAQAQAQGSSVIANLSSENAAQAQAIQQQQQAQLRSQIQRLKTFRSNGRLALELSTDVRSLAGLPDLALEDGDRVLVPSAPGFVAAFGSVNNENVFIYKPGKTVGDVMKSAGLTEDAEADQSFVLRADGSIIARRDRGGLFGGGFESIEVMPGDTVVVPAQIDRESRYNFVTRAVKDWTQIFSNFGLGIAALKTIKSL